MSPDPLKDIFRAALAEAASPGTVDHFVEAFRARAQLVLGERLARLEEQLRVLEEELAWRREVMAALGRDKESLESELRTIGDEHDRLKREAEDLRAERSAASLAHDRLLAHHRDVLTRVAEELETLAASLPAGAAAERLCAQAAALRLEVP